MYLLGSAIGVKFGINKKWTTLDLTTLTVADLYTAYRKVWLTLLLDSDPTPLYLDMDTVRLQYATYADTLAAWLLSLGSSALPTQTTPVVINTQTAQFRDIFKAGYTVTPVTPANLSYDTIPITDKTDVRLTRESPVTDYTSFFTHCLVSVNGFYHLTDTNGVNGVVVSDAMTSLRQAKQNQIGMLSFTKMGSLQLVPITAGMVQQTQAGAVNVTLPVSLTNKTVMLVLGGYLHVLDASVFTNVSDTTFKINFLNVPLLSRYYDSRKYLDLSSLPLSSTPNNLDQISTAELFSPATLLAYLLLSQSFFVVLDCPEVYTQQHYVKRTGLPDMYITYSEPTYPLVTQLGRHPEYWSTLEDGQYSLTIYDSVIDNKLYYTTLTSLLTSVDGVREAMSPGYISNAYLLEIGRDI